MASLLAQKVVLLLGSGLCASPIIQYLSTHNIKYIKCNLLYLRTCLVDSIINSFLFTYIKIYLKLQCHKSLSHHILSADSTKLLETNYCAVYIIGFMNCHVFNSIHFVLFIHDSCVINYKTCATLFQND